MFHTRADRYTRRLRPRQLGHDACSRRRLQPVRRSRTVGGRHPAPRHAAPGTRSCRAPGCQVDQQCPAGPPRLLVQHEHQPRQPGLGRRSRTPAPCRTAFPDECADHRRAVPEPQPAARRPPPSGTRSRHAAAGSLVTRRGKVRPCPPPRPPPAPPPTPPRPQATAPWGNCRSSDVCDRNTRRGGRPSPDMTHSMPVGSTETDSDGPSNRVSTGRRCGQGRGRTADLPLFRRSLVPTELPGRGRCRNTDRRSDPDGTRTRDLRRDRATR